jgi:hypothetical protein
MRQAPADTAVAEGATKAEARNGGLSAIAP